MGGLIIFGYPHLSAVENAFLQNTIIAAVIFLGLLTTILLMRDTVKISSDEIKLWEEIRKEGKRRFVVRETFSGYVPYLASFALAGILILGNYVKGNSAIDSASFYILPTLLILSVQFIASIRSWKAFEKAYFRRNKLRNK